MDVNKTQLQLVLNGIYQSFSNENEPLRGSILAAELADRVHDSTSWVYATLEEVTALFQWQCLQLNGEVDMDELNRTYKWLNRKVQIVNINKPAPPVDGDEDRAKILEI